MNKIKLALIATAILVSIGGAFATRPCAQCEFAQQYIPSGSGYVEVGDLGIDYDCEWSAGTCTYYRPNPGQSNFYAPCHVGTYMEIHSNSK
jgi:hypothetical protein